MTPALVLAVSSEEQAAGEQRVSAVLVAMKQPAAMEAAARQEVIQARVATEEAAEPPKVEARVKPVAPATTAVVLWVLAAPEAWVAMKQPAAMEAPAALALAV
jgi:hypothetical protein